MKRKKGKKKGSKPATVRTPVSDLNTKDTIEHYNAVLVEKIDSQMRLVIEKVDSAQEETRREFVGLRREMNERFEIVEGAIKAVKGEVDELRGEMHSMETRLSDKIDKIGERVEDHEVRITTLEGTRQ